MDTITANRQLEAADIIRMVERLNRRLLPQARFDGFKPCEDVYRIGKGYVTEDAYRQAFAGEPEWAENCYTLQANNPGKAKEWAEIYRNEGERGLVNRFIWGYFFEHMDGFWTYADEQGRMRR